MISYSPEELIDLRPDRAQVVRKRNEKGRARDGARRRLASGARARQNLVCRARQAAGLIRDLALEAIAYLDTHDLVTVPQLCRDSWRIAMMSPEQQLVNPFFSFPGATPSASRFRPLRWPMKRR